MPTIPNTPCAGGCGALLYSSSTSLPAGQSTCRACRNKRAADESFGPRCSIQSCARKAIARGLCNNHYARTMLSTRCSIPGCDEIRHARLMCRKHYRQWSRANGLAASPSDAWSDTRRSNYHARRARAHGARNGDQALLAEVIERDGVDCAYCGEPVDLTLEWPNLYSKSLDHTLPLSRGGIHSLANAQMMHLTCNSRKGNRVDQAFARPLDA